MAELDGGPARRIYVVRIFRLNGEALYIPTLYSNIEDSKVVSPVAPIPSRANFSLQSLQESSAKLALDTSGLSLDDEPPASAQVTFSLERTGSAASAESGVSIQYQ